ncbi:MAG: pyridoxine 5'-phosphate synthase [Granulosicoccaceae bacterium]
MATMLSVNLNAIAQLRNRRDLPWPSVVEMGRIALSTGAHGLTIHPRPDERHIRFSDIPDLHKLIKDDFPSAEFNIEGYPTEQFLEIAESFKPDQITLVPDDPSQATSDHGWDFQANHNLLTASIDRLSKLGIRTALFADPDPAGIPWAVNTGCDRLEFYTGPYGGSYDNPAVEAEELEKLGAAAKAALGAGLGINAGHDLTVDNLPALIKQLPELAEVSIGHGLTADALIYGMEETIKRFLRACGREA